MHECAVTLTGRDPVLRPLLGTELVSPDAVRMIVSGCLHGTNIFYSLSLPLSLSLLTKIPSDFLL